MKTSRGLSLFVGAAIAIGACGTARHQDVHAVHPQPTRPPIGALTASGPGSASSPWPEGIFAKSVDVLSCQQAAAFIGEDPYEITNPPGFAGRPLCYLSDSVRRLGPDGVPLLPDQTGSEPYEAGVLYVPDSVDPTTTTFTSIIRQGGIVVGSEIRGVEVAVPPLSADYNGAGDHVASHITVGSDPAWVVRISPDRVMVRWETTDRLGRRVEVVIGGNYTPDEMADFAARVTQGQPANERPPSPASTATATTSAAPALATTTSVPRGSSS